MKNCPRDDCINFSFCLDHPEQMAIGRRKKWRNCGYKQVCWFQVEECLNEHYVEIHTKNLMVRIFKDEEIVIEDRQKKGYAPAIVSYDRDMGGVVFVNPTVISQLVTKEDDE